MTLLRHRRRIARTLSGARTLRQRMLREWRWFLRDLRDLKAEKAAWRTIPAGVKGVVVMPQEHDGPPLTAADLPSGLPARRESDGHR